MTDGIDRASKPSRGRPTGTREEATARRAALVAAIAEAILAEPTLTNGQIRERWLVGHDVATAARKLAGVGPRPDQTRLQAGRVGPMRLLLQEAHAAGLAPNLAQVAREFGVSRQAAHTAWKKVCEATP